MKKGMPYNEAYRPRVPLEVIKASPAYELLIKEAREHWREVGRKEGGVKMLSLIIAERFPKLKVAQKIRRIRDVALLQQICVQSLDVKDAAALRKLLDEAIKSQSQ